MSYMLMLDNTMTDQIEALAPHKNIFDPNNPRSLTNAASMPSPVASTISSWIGQKRHVVTDPDKIKFLEALAG